eukprot:scaffold41918_cov45-Attheya_sp.AAC.6
MKCYDSIHHLDVIEEECLVGLTKQCSKEDDWIPSEFNIGSGYWKQPHHDITRSSLPVHARKEFTLDGALNFEYA